MKKLVLLILFALLTSPVMAVDIAGFNSYYKDQRFEVRIFSEKIEAAPKWDQKDQNPPLPVQKARTLGTQALQELLPDTHSEWSLKQISLIPLFSGAGKEVGWIYCVEFSGSLPKGVISGSPGNIQIVIYMDGTVAKPDLSKPWQHP